MRLANEIHIGSEIFAIACSSDGATLAIGDKSPTIGLWKWNGEWIGRLHGHSGTVLSISFAPSGQLVASGSADTSVRIWATENLTREPLHVLRGHRSRVTSVSWSHDSRLVASASDDGTVALWDIWAATPAPKVVTQIAEPVNCVAFSPEGAYLACGAFDHNVHLVDQAHPNDTRALEHPAAVNSVAFSPDGSHFAVALEDASVWVWDARSVRCVRRLESHTSPVRAIAYSRCGKWLATKSAGGRVRVWRTLDYVVVGAEREDSTTFIASVAFGASGRLATFGEAQQSVRIWRIDVSSASSDGDSSDDVHYRNAKVVVVGDTGVGKSGVVRRLRNLSFEATESTHAREVHRVERKVVTNDAGPEMREIFIWDLAGQAGYRVVNQLHLHDATVVVIVFDARSETDPFAGVLYWHRAVRQAKQSATTGARAPTFLVVARTDRGAIGSDSRLSVVAGEVCVAPGCFLETSAKEGWGIDELRDLILASIPWDDLPRVVSTQQLFGIRDFVFAVRRQGLQIATMSALYEIWLAQHSEARTSASMELFATVLRRLEPLGVVRRLSFGDHLLLEPELLDACAASIVEAARREPDGLGIVAERDIRDGNYLKPASTLSAETEEILALGTIETLIRHELALRESTNEGSVLVFPAQSLRAAPLGNESLTQAMSVEWHGPIDSVWATLVVRLSRSGVFVRRESWRDGVLFADVRGAHCGVSLERLGEGHARVSVRIHSSTSDIVRIQLERFVLDHLANRAIKSTVRVERLVLCPICRSEVASVVVRARVCAGKRDVLCQMCEARIELDAAQEPPTIVSTISDMSRHADRDRDRDAAVSTIDGKIRSNQYDVFLSYNSEERHLVRQIYGDLRSRGIRPWFDEEDLLPGSVIMGEIGKQLDKIPVCVAFVGRTPGPVHLQEMYVALERLASAGAWVIPVVLPSAPQPPPLPTFLRVLSRVDFREAIPDPMQQLVRGIEHGLQHRQRWL